MLESENKIKLNKVDNTYKSKAYNLEANKNTKIYFLGQKGRI